MTAADIIDAWDQPDATHAIHPTRAISETAYWESGKAQAEMLAADIPAGSKVMDFGVGDGRVAIPLKALGYDVTGVDASANMLTALAANEPELTNFQSDGSDLGKHLGRRKFDAVYCLALLIHHDYATGEELIANLRNVVRKGGLLILDWPVSEHPEEGTVWLDVTTWAQDQQDEVCARLGLEPVNSYLPWGVYRAAKA